jgi:hypothetical protein
MTTPSPIEQLQTAGFSDDEIGQWSTRQRATLNTAGFNEDEIDSYLKGPTRPVPSALGDRLAKGADTLAEMGKLGFTVAARGIGGMVDFLADPLSPVRTIVSPELEHLEQTGRPHPGQAAADLAFSTTGIPETKGP